MQFQADYELMADIDRRYRDQTKVRDRGDYSIFYGPLRSCPLLLINANPGGTRDNYRVVDVMAGQHEYIEGRASGPTTRNGAIILEAIVGTNDPDAMRGVQVLNRYFRRSASVTSDQHRYMQEARPFLAELINHIQPEVLLFGGDSGARLFADAHDARIVAGKQIKGPNGTNEATYYREYSMTIPSYGRTVEAYGIYHPSKMNSFFRENVIPLLRQKIGPVMLAQAA